MRIALQSYRQLVAWQRAANLGIEAYKVASLLPPSERFGLSSQIKRAAVSIAANIAEGYGRGTRGEYLHFLHIAKGSLRELDTHLYFVEALGFVDGTNLEPALRLCDRTGAILDGLIRALQRSRGQHSLPHPAPRPPHP